MPRGSNREQLLDAGLALMYAKGFTAVGIQEIADASGVPKGSFYNYFKSKEDFAVVALDAYADSMSEHLDRTLLTGGGSALRRLRKLLTRWSNEVASDEGFHGCFAGNLSQELANHSPAIRRALKRTFDRLEHYYVQCLVDAKAAGELAERVDAHQAGRFVYNSWQGAVVRAKAEKTAEPLRLCIDVIFKQLLA